MKCIMRESTTCNGGEKLREVEVMEKSVTIMHAARSRYISPMKVLIFIERAKDPDTTLFFPKLGQ